MSARQQAPEATEEALDDESIRQIVDRAPPLSNELVKMIRELLPPVDGTERPESASTGTTNLAPA